MGRRRRILVTRCGRAARERRPVRRSSPSWTGRRSPRSRLLLAALLASFLDGLCLVHRRRCRCLLLTALLASLLGGRSLRRSRCRLCRLGRLLLTYGHSPSSCSMSATRYSALSAHTLSLNDGCSQVHRRMWTSAIGSPHVARAMLEVLAQGDTRIVRTAAARPPRTTSGSGAR